MAAQTKAEPEALTDEEAVDAEVVEEPPTEVEAQQTEYRAMQHGGAVAVREGVMLAEMTTDQLVGRLEKLQDAATKALKDGIDYGTIPGVDKPSLFKPGAEKLCMLFMLDPETDVEERYDRDGHLSVLARTTIYHAPTGVRLGTGVGSCTTRETRYAYRQAQRECPSCGRETVFKSKKNEGEWFCWSKKGGCGLNFDAGSEEALALADVDVGRKARPPEELADYYNTCLKLARKRSLIDGVLVTTGASHIWTQDVEDVAPEVAKTVVVDGPAPVKVPKNWAEMKGALVARYGDETAADFAVFAAQLASALYGGAKVGDVFGKLDPKALDPSQWQAYGQKVAGAVVALLEADETDGFPPPSREQMQAAFAKFSDGAILDGPEWRMGPGEDDRPEGPARAAES